MRKTKNSNENYSKIDQFYLFYQRKEKKWGKFGEYITSCGWSVSSTYCNVYLLSSGRTLSYIYTVVKKNRKNCFPLRQAFGINTLSLSVVLNRYCSMIDIYIDINQKLMIVHCSPAILYVESMFCSWLIFYQQLFYRVGEMTVLFGIGVWLRCSFWTLKYQISSDVLKNIQLWLSLSLSLTL